MSRRIGLLWLMLCLLLTGCSLTNRGRLVYDQYGIRIGIEADPTVSRSGSPVLNSHPARLTKREMESLLQVIHVSGWSGTLAGLLATPRPVALFTPKELSAVSPYLTAAFQEANSNERIFFSLLKPDVAYSEDRTEGSLFLRGRYLHVVVTDHASFLRADTGGGEPRDIRDTKGMKLWVFGSAQAAMVPDAEEPRWAPFEAVHISLNVKDTLAQQIQSPPVLPTASPATTVTQDDLQLQLRDLTRSNTELRGRLEEQNKRMEELHDQLDRLRLELDKTKSKTPSSHKLPAR